MCNMWYRYIWEIHAGRTGRTEQSRWELRIKVENVFTFTATACVPLQSLTSSPACETQQTLRESSAQFTHSTYHITVRVKVKGYRWNSWEKKKKLGKRVAVILPALYKLYCSEHVSSKFFTCWTSPFVVEAVGSMGVWWVVLGCPHDPLSSSVASVGSCLLTCVFPTRRQLGLQVLREVRKQTAHISCSTTSTSITDFLMSKN